jgi:hypothetical protein
MGDGLDLSTGFLQNYSNVGSMLEDPSELRMLHAHHGFANRYRRPLIDSGILSLDPDTSSNAQVPGRPPVSSKTESASMESDEKKYYPANVRFTVELPDDSRDAKSEKRFRELFSESRFWEEK